MSVRVTLRVPAPGPGPSRWTTNAVENLVGQWFDFAGQPALIVGAELEDDPHLALIVINVEELPAILRRDHHHA